MADIQGVNFFLVHFSWHSFTYGLYVNTIALFSCVLLGRKGRGVAACMIVFSVLFLYYSITNAVLSWTLFCFTSILFTLHEIVPITSWPEIETVLRNYTRSTLLNYARSLAKVIYKTIQERLYTRFITF
jgi:hypothetical protein